LKIIKQFINILSPLEKRRALFILIFGICSAFFEIAGLISILPFIAILTNPEIIQDNHILNLIFEYSKLVGINNEKNFLILIGLGMFLLFTFSLCLKAFLTYILSRFSSFCQFNISKRVISGYLKKPYTWFLDRNSTELGKNILSEVSTVITTGLAPFLNLVIYIILLIFILSVLIAVDPIIAFTITIIIGLTYLIFYKFLFLLLKKLSIRRFNSNKWRYTAVSEAFSALKEIKLLGIESTFIDRFSLPAKNLAKSQASMQAINKLPKFAIEAITFGGLLIITIYLISINEDFTNIAPIITLYAFAGYRLMPAFQQVYLSINMLRTVGPALDALHKDLSNIKLYKIKKKDESRLEFKNKIVLQDISYKYPNANQKSLDQINISINTGSAIGILGKTGSGKTTLVDVMLGLLTPDQGKLIIDNKKIKNDNIRSWQNCLGYIPQQIYLSDDTIASNIAFGENKNDINYEKVIEVAKVANIHDFINSELNLKYQTKVGERGSKLSGGQRQRIGIARALYFNPKVLVMDEATNALDSITEKKIISTILNLKNKKTIIFITHNLETIKKFDQLMILEKGKITNYGSYSRLLKESRYLKASMS
jgi:ATP-binding cassette, subfamily B, bacterial PglK